MAETFLTDLAEEDEYELSFDPFVILDDPQNEPYDAEKKFKRLQSMSVERLFMKAEKNTPPDHSALVVKDNVLIPQLAKLELSELRFLAYCLAHYNSKAAKNRRITARVADLCEFFPMHESSAYRVIRQVILSLSKKPAEFQIGKKQYLYHWFSGLVYETDTGEFTFCISPEMEPFLLGLAGNFTQWRLGDVYQFKAASTWKLYENLAQWKNTGRWVVGLDELRLRLGVAGNYPDWYVFNRDVISKAVEEINALSDLRVEYNQEKRGRRVTGLFFLIDKKVDPEVINQDPPEDDLCKLLLDQGINAKTAQDYAKKIKDSGKADTIIAKMPRIAARAQKHKGPVAKYILGAINNELVQMNLFEAPKETKPDHTESLNCWTQKRQTGEACPVRQRGKAGQRKKCQICLDKLPVDTFGV